MKQAIILVGGRGTRLGSHAASAPKPMLPMAGDVCFLDYLLFDVARHGITEIILLAGHMADQVEARYAGHEVLGARLKVIAEPAPAGTAGALRNAANALDAKFLMLNGDSIFDVNYLGLTHALRDDALGVLALRRVPDGARYGRVESKCDRVIGFHEKDATFQGEALISAGVYALKREVLDLVTAIPCSIETDVFPKLAAAGKLVGRESDGFFIDIGLPETLIHAREHLGKQMRRGAAFFDRDGTLNRDSGYTHKPEQLAWLPGAIEAVRRCNDAGRFVIVVTNQAGVARGYYDQAAVARFHTHMQSALAAHGAHVDGFYYCPYHGDATVQDYALADHPDRKPNPGMIRRALTEWPIDATRSFLIGDSEHDMQAAAALGLQSYRVAPGEILPMVERALARTHASRTVAAPNTALRERARAARAWLFDHALPLWWRSGFDQDVGCFSERLSQDGAPLQMPLRVRVQARQTIVYALAGRLGWPGPWRDAVEAGARVLLQRCIRADGGTRHLLSPEGSPLDERRDLYDVAFVLFALAEAGRTLGNRADLLAAADRQVQWLEASWAHPAGGYREGEIAPTPPRRQNPHMHIFEALLALFEAGGDTRHLARAGAIAALFERRFFNAHFGALTEYFDDQWAPLGGEDGRIVEPGHLFEWSWLLHRWNRLGGGELGAVAETLRVYGEVYGVDRRSGIVFDETWLDGRPRKRSSRLWPHAERLKANAVRFERTRDPAAADAAAMAYDMLMSYCNTPISGLWRDSPVSSEATDEPALASSFYHIALALTELIRVTEI